MNSRIEAHIKTVFYLFCATIHDKINFNMMQGAWNDMMQTYSMAEILTAIDSLLETSEERGFDRVVATLRTFREGVVESKTAELLATEVINNARH